MRAFRILLIATAVLAGCAEFPDLESRITPGARNAPFPSLVPAGQITGRRSLARTTAADGERLAARAAALRARARLLRGISIDDDTRRRLAPLLNRLGG